MAIIQKVKADNYLFDICLKLKYGYEQRDVLNYDNSLRRDEIH